jgi:hypothetical protein
VEQSFSDGSTEIYVETWEPGKCECRRSLALSTLTHLLANVIEQELWLIQGRDTDEAGHTHQVARGIDA